ncbi:hypothetical protein HNP40_002170 [Mycobacteroides chelonae]|nr:hypothetical protein [Mycobacteroides chelonae]
MAQEAEPGYPPLPYEATGLQGRRARIIVEHPHDDQGFPATFSEGTREVIIDDDEPSVFTNLAVYVPGHKPENPMDMQLVRADQLSLLD